MKAQDRAKLYEIVRAALADPMNDRQYVEGCIYQAHCGRLRGFVNGENLHLFRRYRNQVTGDSRRLVSEALGEIDELTAR